MDNKELYNYIRETEEKKNDLLLFKEKLNKVAKEELRLKIETKNWFYGYSTPLLRCENYYLKLGRDTLIDMISRMIADYDISINEKMEEWKND